MSLQTSVNEQTGTLEETLQLRCPMCNGGLNLKRKHLGITGQCVHCHGFFTAIEEFGAIRVVAGATPTTIREVPVASTPAPAPAEAAQNPAPVEAPPSLSAVGFSGAKP